MFVFFVMLKICLFFVFDNNVLIKNYLGEPAPIFLGDVIFHSKSKINEKKEFIQNII